MLQPSGYVPLPSPPLAFAAPPHAMALPIFQLESRFNPIIATSAYYFPAAGGGADATDARRQRSFFGSAALAAMHNDDGATLSDSPLPPSMTGSSSARRGPSPAQGGASGVVLSDAAVEGPVMIDLDLGATQQLDLNKAPPNWKQRDDAHAGHVHWPWRNTTPTPPFAGLGMVDAAAAAGAHHLTGLEELLDVLQQQLADRHADMCHTADGSSPPDDTVTASEAEEVRLPDVVCGAEDLKALLMAPFAASKPLNLLVHRIGESLLIEGAARFDLPGTGVGVPTTVGENRRKVLASKLLYYSILGENDAPVPLMTSTSPPPLQSRGGEVFPDAVPPPPLGPAAASPPPSPPASGGDAVHFRRTMRWKFDDLSLLLGLRTPLVRSRRPSEGPSMTLQLHDTRDYITQLEALEFWLDNILNCVGHVAICFHTDGVVQGYRVIATDDLPDLGSVPFSPVAVQAHATNVLKWLQGSCARDGGSYVLMRSGGDSKELRLYDLDDLHRFRDAAVATALHTPAATATAAAVSMLDPNTQCAAPPAAPPPLLAGPARPPPTAQATSPPLAAIDDDSTATASSHDQTKGACTTTSLATARRAFTAAFDQPIAIMCYKMAQCLPPTDAEGLRLLLRCLALLPPHGAIATALLRAAAHAQVAQHYAGAGGLASSEDSDYQALVHARGAVQDLATVFCADVEVAFIPLRPNESPLESAIGVGIPLVQLLCGAATRHCGSGRLREAIAELATVQGYISHFQEAVPAGLLTEGPSPPTPSSPSSLRTNAASGATAAAGSDGANKGKASRGTRAGCGTAAADAAVHAEDLRAQVLLTAASIEEILGDIEVQLLERVGADEAKVAALAPSVPSPHRDDLSMQRHVVRELNVAAQHATAEVMTQVYRGRLAHDVDRGDYVPPLSYAEALEALPEQLAPLRRLADVEPTGERLFEAAIAYYHSAIARVSLVSGNGSEASVVDLQRKIARAHGVRAVALGMRYSCCEALIKEQQEVPPPPAGGDTRAASLFSRSHRLELAETFLMEAEAAFAAAKECYVSVKDPLPVVKQGFNQAMLRLKIAERSCAGSVGYNPVEQGHLETAVQTLKDAINYYHAATTPASGIRAAASDPAAGDLLSAAEASLANMYLVSAARYSQLLSCDPTPQQPAPQSVMQTSVGNPAVTTLDGIEKYLCERCLIPAIKAAKAARRVATEIRCLHTLADARRVFAGLEEAALSGATALPMVPLKPIEVSPALRKLIKARPAAERRDRAMLAVASLKTVQAFSPYGSTIAMTCFAADALLIADLHLMTLKLLQDTDAFDLRVTNVEAAVGAVHDLRPMLQQFVDDGLAPEANPTERERNRAYAQELGRFIARRLAEVLLHVLRMQQHQQGKGAHDGGVKLLCDVALRAQKAPLSDPLEPDSAAMLALSILTKLSSVFRSFTDRKRHAQQSRR